MKKPKVVFIFQTHRTLENQEKVIAVYIQTAGYIQRRGCHGS